MYRFLAVFLALTFGAAGLSAQSEHPKTGRRIAGVMGFGGAEWLERSEREIEEMPDTALTSIGVKEGMTVADVGAGSGYFTVRLSRKVGAAGKVYANDIQPEMLRLLRQRLAKAQFTNIETVLGTEADPKLPAKSQDLILMVDVYHEFAQPQKMLRKLREALKDDGRLVLLEYRKEDPWVPIRPEHKMSVAEAKLEVEDEGFLLDSVKKDLPRQHILIFKKALAAAKN
ncbi:MAG: methyltransferase domain-containing protein [Acidobacteria bacterium]|nr:methyltransferase domain-containing protein [Acidobacteriota bacterium]